MAGVASLQRERFQSPCAGNMFGKKRVATPVPEPHSQGFNPRVRGTCLVRAVSNVLYALGEGVSYHARFNPRVRGTCLVSPVS